MENSTVTDAPIIFPWYDIPFSAAIVTLYGFLIAFSTVANVLVCLAVIVNPNLRRFVSSYFIVSLAISDLLTTCLSMPFDMEFFITHGQWPYTESFCIVRTTIYLIAIPTSILNLLVLSIDRYKTLKDPWDRFKESPFMTPKRALAIIFALWSYCLVMAIVPLTGAKYYPSSLYMGVCIFNISLIYNIVINFVNFVLPMLIMCVIYYKIYQIAHTKYRMPSRPRQRENRINESPAGRSRQLMASQASVPMNEELHPENRSSRFKTQSHKKYTEKRVTPGNAPIGLENAAFEMGEKDLPKLIGISHGDGSTTKDEHDTREQSQNTSEDNDKSLSVVKEVTQETLECTVTPENPNKTDSSEISNEKTLLGSPGDSNHGTDRTHARNDNSSESVDLMKANCDNTKLSNDTEKRGENIDDGRSSSKDNGNYHECMDENHGKDCENRNKDGANDTAISRGNVESEIQDSETGTSKTHCPSTSTVTNEANNSPNIPSIVHPRCSRIQAQIHISIDNTDADSTSVASCDTTGSPVLSRSPRSSRVAPAVSGLASESPDLFRNRCSTMETTVETLPGGNGNVESSHAFSNDELPNANSLNMEDKAARSLTLKRKKIFVKNTRAARTISIIVSAFLICWGPQVIFSIAMSFCGVMCGWDVPIELGHVLVLLGYLNSLLNPLLFSFQNAQFRKAYWRIIMAFCPCVHRNEVLPR